MHISTKSEKQIHPSAQVVVNIAKQSYISFSIVKTYKEARKTLFQKASRDTRNIGKLLLSRDLLPHLFRFIRNTGCFRICNRVTDTQ